MLCVSKRTQSIPRYLRLSFLTLQRGNAAGDAPRHRFAPRRSSQDRTRSVQNGMPTRSMGTIVRLSFLTLPPAGSLETQTQRNIHPLLGHVVVLAPVVIAAQCQVLSQLLADAQRGPVQIALRRVALQRETD
ncbi:hypothetical protein CFBP2118_00531 [Pseudomonas syringae pv. syringae]|nr:hypothetical protein CFBP2118_00531 [Pseudomonas syringae pv. syringae]